VMRIETQVLKNKVLKTQRPKVYLTQQKKKKKKKKKKKDDNNNNEPYDLGY
jgi:hypothetical protein